MRLSTIVFWSLRQILTTFLHGNMVVITDGSFGERIKCLQSCFRSSRLLWGGCEGGDNQYIGKYEILVELSSEESDCL